MKRILIIIAIFINLIGCGGGGGKNEVPVAEINSPPVSSESSIATIQDITVRGKAVAIDENDAFIKYLLVTNVQHGTLLLDENTGGFTYAPDSDFTGSDYFIFKVYDGKAYSDEAKVEIFVNTPSTGQNPSDLTPPSQAVIVSSNSLNPDSATVFWLNAEDNITTSENIIYEVHFSPIQNFTPDAATKKIAIKNSLEADVAYLNPDTTYYIKVKTIDEAGNESVSEEETLITPSQAPTLVNPTKIKNASDLFIQDVVVKDGTLTFNDDALDLPAVGDILIGNAEDCFLKYVESIDKINGKVNISTSQASMSDVFDQMSMTSKVMLFDVAGTDEAGLTQKRAVTKEKHFKIGKQAEEITSWASGRFSVSRELEQPLPMKRATKQSVSNSVMSINTNEGLVSVKNNEKLLVDFNARINSNEQGKFGLISMKLKSLTHPRKNNPNNFGAYFSSSSSLQNYASGVLKWYPAKNHVSPDPYTATIEVKALDLSCGGVLDLCDEVDETIEVKIYVIDNGRVDIGKILDPSHSADYSLINDVNIGFNPILSTETVIEHFNIKKAEVSLAGVLDFDVLTTFNFDVKDTTEYTSTIIKPKTYKSLYMVGQVPVYQEVTFDVKANFKAISTGAIKATSDLDTDFTVKAGIRYENGQWSRINEESFNKDYTATIKVSGGVTLEVRLIPNIEVKFYKCATAGLSVEPWALGEIEAEGILSFNTDFESSDYMGLYGLNDLNILFGIDANLYADLTVLGRNIARYPSGGGKINIFGDTYRWPIFSLPTIKLSESGDLLTNGYTNINAAITDGTNNPFNYKNVSWRVFPKDGAAINWDPLNPTKATFTFTKKDEYKVYFIGSSEKLGDYFGQQYESITLDTREGASVNVVVSK